MTSNPHIISKAKRKHYNQQKHLDPLILKLDLRYFLEENLTSLHFNVVWRFGKGSLLVELKGYPYVNVEFFWE